MNNGSYRQPIPILLIDKHQMVRQGLRALFEQQSGIKVVGEASTYSEALACLADTSPNVILLDIDLGDERGLDLIVDLRNAAPTANILVLTGLNDAAQHHQAVMFGAIGLVLKTQTFATLVQAIERVHLGQAWLDPALVANVVGELARTRSTPAVDPEISKIASLTERERTVIKLVCEGLQNRAIAQRLALSETTVRHHLTSIFTKLEVEHRLELLIYAFRNGLAPLPQ
ncbi:MAG: response regulator transcription factor [Oscillochloris sp.]|nr:response regulator transcription factor [Oscillochloris sp.]